MRSSKCSGPCMKRSIHQAEQEVAQHLALGAVLETGRFQCFERLLLFGIERQRKFSLG